MAGKKDAAAVRAWIEAFPDDTLQTCAKCGELKPLSDYPPRGKGRHGKRRYPYCRACHRDNQRLVMLDSLFNITPEDKQTMRLHQGGVCAICGRTPRKLDLAVDHDHKTGELRGLLCHRCNRALGWMQDKPELFERAASYLREPPWRAAFGRSMFGLPGRISNKRKRRKRGPRGARVIRNRVAKLRGVVASVG